MIRPCRPRCTRRSPRALADANAVPHQGRGATTTENRRSLVRGFACAAMPAGHECNGNVPHPSGRSALVYSCIYAIYVPGCLRGPESTKLVNNTGELSQKRQASQASLAISEHFLHSVQLSDYILQAIAFTYLFYEPDCRGFGRHHLSCPIVGLKVRSYSQAIPQFTRKPGQLSGISRHTARANKRSCGDSLGPAVASLIGRLCH